MMRNEGSMVPNAVIMLPRIPRSRYPIKMDRGRSQRTVISKQVNETTVSFGYDFVFYQRYHGITAAKGKGSYLKKKMENASRYIFIFKML